MTQVFQILVAEDEAAQRNIIADILRQEGFDVREAGSGAEALRLALESPPDILLCDWKLPEMEGGEVLAEVRRQGIPCGFIVMTAYGSIAHAMEAIRMGADDYLAKPFEREVLLLAIRRLQRTRRLERENRRLREEITEQSGFGEIYGRSPAMQQLFRKLGKVAATDATVLIIGESGTGKELVARTLHEQSPRADRPFVALNCGAIPESLMESELFGHERGAFTGADRRREGKFEEAEGGTLFLDEITAMSLGLQAALLRVLQERRFTRLGGKGELPCDVRMVAAANQDLNDLVREGRFREDLYYRLNVVPLVIPPLRERREDIPLLAGVLLERISRRYSLSLKPLPPAVLRVVMEYAWPGNVRELGNVLERLALLAEDGRMSMDDLPLEIRQPETGAGCPFRLPAEGIQWDEMEQGLLGQALSLAGQNRTQAARLLGMSYKTFLYRLEKYGLA
jgi:two-component system NtrC family response regulator